jgi:hypothetical protein
MSAITSTFAMEVFDRRRGRSDRLAEFLALYVHYFGPEHRTATNELVEFLSSPVAGQSITYFGLTYDDKPCGFATFMYYPEGPIGIVDHLVIAPNLRGYGGFFSFCDLIASYLERQRIALDHIISEIMLDDRSLASNVKPAVLVRMMRLIGFKAAKTAYWAPDPAILQDPDSCKAVILFASRPEREDLPVGEFIRLVQLIYKTHYGCWYARTMPKDQFERYQKAADGLLKRIQASTAKEKRIILNGMKNYDLVFSVDPNPAADASALFYIGLLAIPAAVGIAVAFTQELRVAAVAASISIVGIGLFATNKKLRRLLMRAFQLK